MEIYIALEKAAELENISYKGMSSRIIRNPENYIVKKESGESGGKERTLVALSSLSAKARKEYRQAEKIEEMAATEADSVELPWYAAVDLNWFIENNKVAYHKAVELGNVIREFLDYSDSDRTSFAETFAQERLGKGQRTLYRYAKAYLEASAWADKLSKENGGNYEFFKVLCLCRKPKETDTFPSFTEEVKQIIKNIWFDKEFARNRRKIEDLYENLEKIAAVNGWEKIPSYKSVARYINYLMNKEGMKNAHDLAKKGERDYKNQNMVKAKRDTSSLKVMEIIMGDEHTFDLWVSYQNPNGKITAIRPKLVAWIDLRSRHIMGCVMCKDANSEILKQSLLKLIYHDAGSLPEYLYIDNGKDYTSKEMTGISRKDRRKKDIDFDDATKGFYKSIGIKDDHEALPYQPWSKGQIERFFLTVCNKFSRKFASYTGTLTGSKTDDKINKDINQMLEAGKLLTIEEFFKEWNQWIESYERKIHRGLKEAKEKWHTPYEVFQYAERYEKAAPPKSYAKMLMLKSDKVRVYNTGINRFGYDYRSDELCDYIDKLVNIKYDPYDLSIIYVFDESGKQICEAYSQELLSISGAVTEDLLNHIKMQKRQLRRDKERLAEATRPIEAINPEVKAFNPVTGGIDLTIEGKGIKKAKVVAMPEDRTYAQNRKLRKEEPEESESSFMNQSAEAALKKLRVMS